MDTGNRSVQELPKVLDYIMKAKKLVNVYQSLGLNTIDFQDLWNLLLENADAYDLVQNSISRIEKGEPEFDFMNEPLNDFFATRPLEGEILETIKTLKEDFGL